MGILDGKAVIVTGGGRGIGRGHCLHLAEQGASVVVNDIDLDEAKKVVGEISEQGGKACANDSNIASREGAKALVQHCVDEFGAINAAVNNAGNMKDRSFLKMSDEEFDSVLQVHVYGTFRVSQEACLRFKEQGTGGAIVNTISAAHYGNFGQTNYAAAKAGLVGFMNALKLEGAKYDVLVNAVAPIAHTRMTEEILGDMADRFDAESVAPAVAYLASEANRYSGELWSVGGGSVSRVFTALCEGYFKHPDRDGPLTVEDVAEHVDDVRTEDGYIVPVSSRDEFAKLGPMFYS
jgi:NAD(P)-dependent dehydrogenase (short-subunit alcohol dehydrogenase family)